MLFPQNLASVWNVSIQNPAARGESRMTSTLAKHGGTLTNQH